MSTQLSAMLRKTDGEETREEGKLPGVVYGAGGTTDSLVMEYKEFDKMFQVAGASTLIDLSVEGKEVGKVLVQEVQYNPVNDRILHVDLRRIDMNKALTAMVELHFIGESPVVKAEGGTLVRTIQKVEVKCLPKDLVNKIDVDVSVLKTFDDVVKVKDLNLPAGVTVMGLNDEDAVVTATPALTEDQLKALEEAGKQGDLSKIEVAGKKKEDEEAAAEGAEGAAAPAAGEKPAQGGSASGGKEEKKK